MAAVEAGIPVFISQPDDKSYLLSTYPADPVAPDPGVTNERCGWGSFRRRLRLATSAAAVIAAGYFALAKQKWPDATGNQLLQSMIRTTGLNHDNADPVRDPAFTSGWGIMSLTRMLANDPSQYPDINPMLAYDVQSDREYRGEDGQYLPSSHYGARVGEIYDAMVAKADSASAAGSDEAASGAEAGGVPGWVVPAVIAVGVVVVGAVVVWVVTVLLFVSAIFAAFALVLAAAIPDAIHNLELVQRYKNHTVQSCAAEGGHWGLQDYTERVRIFSFRERHHSVYGCSLDNPRLQESENPLHSRP